MTKDELIRRFREWRDDDENEKIIAAVIALPENLVDAEILSWLAQSYIDIGEYKRAIAVLENLHESMENDYKWQFMMGLALLRASDDDECYDDDDLLRNILERAKVCFARGMNMNPPEDVLESADRFMEETEVRLDELNGSDENDFDDDLEAYDDEELDVLEEHIKDNYGDFPTVFHETVSKDIIIDIACIPPTEEHNFYTLVTMGMGAHIMNIPDSLSPEENGRAELLICLPPDWKLGESSEEWFWPIALLKDLARLPINTDSWLGWGHSVDHRTAFSERAGFCGTLLLYPEGVPEGAETCTLPNGDRVNFFEVIPLYRDEMIYKVNNDTKSLLEHLSKVSHIVDINRPNCCEGISDNTQRHILDSSKMHSDKIDEKNLPIDKINGCNHLAIFLRWCIENSLIAPEFYENCPDIVKGVKDGSRTDIREFINDRFDGCLEPYQFSYVGACFTDYYYNYDRNDPEHFFPADVDDYAEHYFGTKRYNSEEFQDEAYMFVPFDEEYYKGMSKYIARAFRDFLPDFAKYREKQDTELISKAQKLLGVRLVLPKYYDGSIFKETFRDTAYMAKASGQCALPIIVDECGALYDNENIEDILSDVAEPFLVTTSIAGFPEADPAEWAKKNISGEFSVITPTDRMLSSLNVLKNLLGANPALFTFDEKEASLLLPLESGAYLHFRFNTFKA